MRRAGGTAAETSASAAETLPSIPEVRIVVRLLAALSLWAALSLQLGCAALTEALVHAAAGGDYLASVVDVAEAGTAAYLRRHPSQDVEAATAASVRRVRQRLAVYRALVAAGRALDDGEVMQARVDTLTAYAELRELLEVLGVLDATPPPGGAEGTGPRPGPVDLPTAAEVEALW